MGEGGGADFQPAWIFACVGNFFLNCESIFFVFLFAISLALLSIRCPCQYLQFKISLSILVATSFSLLWVIMNVRAPVDSGASSSWEKQFFSEKNSNLDNTNYSNRLNCLLCSYLYSRGGERKQEDRGYFRIYYKGGGGISFSLHRKK